MTPWSRLLADARARRTRCIAYPVGPRVVVELEDGRRIEGYEPPPGYVQGTNEVIWTGRRVS